MLSYLYRFSPLLFSLSAFFIFLLFSASSIFNFIAKGLEDNFVFDVTKFGSSSLEQYTVTGAQVLKNCCLTWSRMHLGCYEL